jgi:uncharacterized protein
MNGTRGTRCRRAVFGALAALALFPAHPQQAPDPLPDGYMRAPAVPAGLAPKVRIAESQTAAHIFDLNFSPGDEIMSGLTDLVLERNITSGHITGLGGLSGALLAWGDPEVGAFKMIRVDEKCELISLLGHVAVRDGKPYVHLHAVVGFRDGSTKAGHVMEAHVAPLAEVSLVATSLGENH